MQQISSAAAGAFNLTPTDHAYYLNYNCLNKKKKTKMFMKAAKISMGSKNKASISVSSFSFYHNRII